MKTINITKDSNGIANYLKAVADMKSGLGIEAHYLKYGYVFPTWKPSEKEFKKVMPYLKATTGKRGR